jgi:SMC interacting uncharacterized protein involved in chromosome segregation
MTNIITFLRRVPKSILLLVAAFFLLVLSASAFTDQTKELKDQIKLLELRISQAQQEWVIVAQQKVEAQRACNVVAEKENQLKRLNQLNNARRGEIELLQQKIRSLTDLPR